MQKWEREICYVSRYEVIKYCVNDFDWQQFRINVLKGTSTAAKLELLKDWLVRYKCNRASVCQVDNYLGALKRGGQISATGEILK